MAKKKKMGKNALMLVTAVIVCFAFVAAIMMFLPAVKISYTIPLINKEIASSVSGMEAVFGGTAEIEGLGSFETFKFNTLSLVGYLLPLLGLIVALVGYKFRSSLAYIISAVLCLAGTIMIFLEPTFFVSANELKEALDALKGAKVSLLAGPIIGGICGIIATLASGFAAVVKK